jgi:hypothetical protein
MKVPHSLYNHICNRNNLMAAYSASRDGLSEAGVSDEAISDYECELRENLLDLEDLLINGSYYSVRLAPCADEERRVIEDIVVQRAIFNVLGPIFESQFMDCSFGFRSTRNRRMAAGRLLCHRESGDEIVAESEIADCFDSLNPDLLMMLLGDRIQDERLLRLIWMWLEDGRIAHIEDGPRGLMGSLNPVGLLYGHADKSIETTIARMLFEFNLNDLPDSISRSHVTVHSKFKSILKPLLRGAGKFALASTIALIASKVAEKRMNKPINPKLVLIAAAAMLAALNLPAVARFLSKKATLLGAEGELDEIAINSLSGLLINIALNEFDQAMMAARIHMVRYGGQFVITARDAQSARVALNLATRELSRLGLHLDQSKTRIASFNQGVELIGYRFHQSKIAAEPVLRPVNWMTGLTNALKARVESAAPTTFRFTGRIKERIQSGIKRFTTITRRSSTADPHQGI